MENQIKFTTDGKKVVILGSLNSQEKIVQEIFIVNGSEIPSGEHFVVKSLHDFPAVSWKEKSLKDLEEKYNRETKQWEQRIEIANKKFKTQAILVEEKLNYLGCVLKNANKDCFDSIVNYITGKITHVVVLHYSTPKLYEISEFNQLYENRLRLISIFGKDHGDFQYAVGEYYDFSGGNKVFFPFTSYSEALEKFSEIILSGNVNNEVIEIANKYSITLDKEKLSEFYKNKNENLKKNIEKYKSEIEKWESEIIIQ